LIIIRELIELKKIAILTNFSSYFRAYSLNLVAERQIKMLVNNGYKPKFIVMETFKPEGAYNLVELCKIPNIHCYNDWGETKNDKNLEKDVEMLKGYLDTYLKDVDVVITHDLIFQAGMWKYNIAARYIAEKYPKIRWLHWVHSCSTDRDDKKNKFPNSFVVYPNSYDLPRVAGSFGYDEGEVKVVPHPIDICEFFGFHPISEKLVNEKDILSSDIIMTYPLRLDRGKQPEMCIKIMGQLKKLGLSVSMVFLDFHSTGGDKPTYRNELKELGKRLGLADKELTFISEYDKSVRLECPHQIVKDFMCISNVFCLPSRSETFSLVAQEAAITGNLVILNFDFPPMRSIYGDYPLYRKFSSNININDGCNGETNTKYDNEDGFFGEIARRVMYEIKHSRTSALRTKIRQEHNLNAVFKQYLGPLLGFTEE
jgi:glycosyltransferase involved in cell wall biosynthesis